jgi:hypothetical protein
MSATRHIASALIGGLALLAGTPSEAAPDESVVVANVLGPEGPLYVDPNLYFVGWVSGTLSRWDGHAATVLNKAPDCGHNGLALTKERTFLLACTDAKGAILELDLAGKELRRWTADDRGRPFNGGINDVVVTDNGGAYAVWLRGRVLVPLSVELHSLDKSLFPRRGPPCFPKPVRSRGSEPERSRGWPHPRLGGTLPPGRYTFAAVS